MDEHKQENPLCLVVRVQSLVRLKLNEEHEHAPLGSFTSQEGSKSHVVQSVFLLHKPSKSFIQIIKKILQYIIFEIIFDSNMGCFDFFVASKCTWNW